MPIYIELTTGKQLVIPNKLCIYSELLSVMEPEEGTIIKMSDYGFSDEVINEEYSNLLKIVRFKDMFRKMIEYTLEDFSFIKRIRLNTEFMMWFRIMMSESERDLINAINNDLSKLPFNNDTRENQVKFIQNIALMPYSVIILSPNISNEHKYFTALYYEDFKTSRHYISNYHDSIDGHRDKEFIFRFLVGTEKLEGLKELMKDYGDIDVKIEGNYAFNLACELGNINIVNWLIGKGCEFNENSLIYSCKSGNIELIKMILEKGINISIRKNTPIKTALMNDRDELVKYLIESGLVVANMENSILLLMALKRHNYELSEYLNGKGCEYFGTKNNCIESVLNNLDENGFDFLVKKESLNKNELKRIIRSSSVIKDAFLKEKYRFVLKLIDVGGLIPSVEICMYLHENYRDELRIDEDNLVYAVTNKNIELLKFLIESHEMGVVDILNKQKMINIALQNLDYEMIKYITSQIKVSVEGLDGDMIERILYSEKEIERNIREELLKNTKDGEIGEVLSLVKAVWNDEIENVRKHLDGGTNYKWHQYAIFRYASTKNKMEITQMLLDKDIENNDKGEIPCLKAHNYASFRWSATYGHLEMVKYLHLYGSDIHAMDDDALRGSAIRGKVEVFKWLLDNGAKYESGENGSYWNAIKENRIEIMEEIIRRGYDTNINNSVGFLRCCKENKLEMAKLLYGNGADYRKCCEELKKSKLTIEIKDWLKKLPA